VSPNSLPSGSPEFYNVASLQSTSHAFIDLKPKVSIVIPVYNGANYLWRTLVDISRQEFSSYEVILVNDCSTDGSREIIEEAMRLNARIRYFETPANLGTASKVINFVSKHIRGEYFVYSSQDDLYSSDWLASMYIRAKETNADATIPELVFYHDSSSSKSECKHISGLNGDKSIVLNGREAFLHSLDWTIPGNALWKSWLIRQFSYFDFSYNADEYTARLYFLHCKTVAFSNGVFFYRQDNPEAITKVITQKTYLAPYTDLMLWRLAVDNAMPSQAQLYLAKRTVNGMIYFSHMLIRTGRWPAQAEIEYCFRACQAAGLLKWIRTYHESKASKAELFALHSLPALYFLGALYLIRRILAKVFSCIIPSQRVC